MLFASPQAVVICAGARGAQRFRTEFTSPKPGPGKHVMRQFEGYRQEAYGSMSYDRHVRKQGYSLSAIATVN